MGKNHYNTSSDYRQSIVGGLDQPKPMQFTLRLQEQSHRLNKRLHTQETTLVCLGHRLKNWDQINVFDSKIDCMSK